MVGLIRLNEFEEHYAPIVDIDDKNIYFNDSVYGKRYPRTLDELLPDRLQWIAAIY